MVLGRMLALEYLEGGLFCYLVGYIVLSTRYGYSMALLYMPVTCSFFCVAILSILYYYVAYGAVLKSLFLLLFSLVSLLLLFSSALASLGRQFYKRKILGGVAVCVLFDVILFFQFFFRPLR
jgi:hypothetical protein